MAGPRYREFLIDSIRARGTAVDVPLEGMRIGRVTVREPTLEDAYVRLVGGKA